MEERGPSPPESTVLPPVIRLTVAFLSITCGLFVLALTFAMLGWLALVTGTSTNRELPCPIWLAALGIALLSNWGLFAVARGTGWLAESIRCRHLGKPPPTWQEMVQDWLSGLLAGVWLTGAVGALARAATVAQDDWRRLWEPAILLVGTVVAHWLMLRARNGLAAITAKTKTAP